MQTLIYQVAIPFQLCQDTSDIEQLSRVAKSSCPLMAGFLRCRRGDRHSENQDPQKHCPYAIDKDGQLPFLSIGPWQPRFLKRETHARTVEGGRQKKGSSPGRLRV
jgi:hypothetical protein